MPVSRKMIPQHVSFLFEEKSTFDISSISFSFRRSATEDRIFFHLGESRSITNVEPFVGEYAEYAEDRRREFCS